MIPETRSRRSRKGNVLILITLMLPFLVGLVGLAIDATMCYIVQTELSAAADGAALGTGRLLTTNANPTDIANEFLNANFRVGQAGFWGAYNLNPTVTVDNGISKTVNVSASVTVPLLFMRVLHYKTATVAATATATRRDARIEFVIDRSGSMNTTDHEGSTVIDDLIGDAQGFTEQFTEGYDELGLVVFDGSAVVGYPTSPWPASTSPTASGGPDTSFYSGGTTDMVHQIGAIKANGATGMGEALALAYVELQKAHMRDMAANGRDTRTNAIVLFTDGVPSAVAAYLNNRNGSVIKSTSGCTYQTDTSTPSHPMYGHIDLGSSYGGAPPYKSADGFFQLASLDSAHTSAWYMANPASTYGESKSPPLYPSSTSGCNTSGWSSPINNISTLPSTDKYGYSLGPNGSGYKFSAMVGNAQETSLFDGTEWNPSGSNRAYQFGLAAWDEVDQAAEAIRTDANFANRTGDTSPMQITIFTVGYTGNGGTDYGLLEKIANVNGCFVNNMSCYKNTQPAGLYVQASNKTALSNAFSVIASAILRLAH